MNLPLLPQDTTLEASRVQFAILRRMPAHKRLGGVLEKTAPARRYAAAGVRSRHPDYTDEQVRLAVLQLSGGRGLGPTGSLGGRGEAMTQDEFLAQIADLLDAAGIPFMVA